MSAERVLGGFEALASLSHGRERVALLFTRDRLIVVSMAKLGRASMALSQIMGRFASGADGLRGKKDLERLSEMSPDQILASSKSSFGISYGSVAAVLVESEDAWTSGLTLVTDRQKFFFVASSVAVAGVRELLSALLGSKLDYRA